MIIKSTTIILAMLLFNIVYANPSEYANSLDSNVSYKKYADNVFSDGEVEMAINKIKTSPVAKNILKNWLMYFNTPNDSYKNIPDQSIFTWKGYNYFKKNNDLSVRLEEGYSKVFYDSINNRLILSYEFDGLHVVDLDSKKTISFDIPKIDVNDIYISKLNEYFIFGNTFSTSARGIEDRISTINIANGKISDGLVDVIRKHGNCRIASKDGIDYEISNGEVRLFSFYCKLNRAIEITFSDDGDILDVDKKTIPSISLRNDETTLWNKSNKKKLWQSKKDKNNWLSIVGNNFDKHDLESVSYTMESTCGHGYIFPVTLGLLKKYGVKLIGSEVFIFGDSAAGNWGEVDLCNSYFEPIADAVLTTNCISSTPKMGFANYNWSPSGRYIYISARKIQGQYFSINNNGCDNKGDQKDQEYGNTPSFFMAYIDPKSLKKEFIMANKTPFGVGAKSYEITFSPKEKRIAFLTERSEIWFYRLNGKNITYEYKIKSPLFSREVNQRKSNRTVKLLTMPDENKLVVVRHDGLIISIDRKKAKTKTSTRSQVGNIILASASPNNQYIALYGDKGIQLFNAQLGMTLSYPFNPLLPKRQPDKDPENLFGMELLVSDIGSVELSIGLPDSLTVWRRKNPLSTKEVNKILGNLENYTGYYSMEELPECLGLPTEIMGCY